jgi:hypothetical protein
MRADAFDLLVRVLEEGRVIVYEDDVPGLVTTERFVLDARRTRITVSRRIAAVDVPWYIARALAERALVDAGYGYDERNVDAVASDLRFPDVTPSSLRLLAVKRSCEQPNG